MSIIVSESGDDSFLSVLPVYEQRHAIQQEKPCPVQAIFLPRLGKRSWIFVTWEKPGSGSAGAQAEDGGQ